MDAWDGWPFARLYLLLVAVAILVVGAQVFLFHWRAAFRSKAMYGPVVMARSSPLPAWPPRSPATT